MSVYNTCTRSQNRSSGLFIGKLSLARETDPEVIKLFSFSTQLSTKFQLLIKTKIPTNKEVFALSLSDVVFIKLI